jgi:hypothetical protein
MPNDLMRYCHNPNLTRTPTDSNSRVQLEAKRVAIPTLAPATLVASVASPVLLSAPRRNQRALDAGLMERKPDVAVTGGDVSDASHRAPDLHRPRRSPVQ